MMKNILYFFLLCLAFIGAVNGVCYLIDGEVVSALGVVALTYLAFPEAKRLFNEIKG